MRIVNSAGFILALVSIVCIFLPVVLGLTITSGESQNFETVRGELLGSYNSQIVAHTAIILGLIIALGTVGRDAINALGGSKAFYRLLGHGTLATLLFLVLYEVGRLSFWTNAASILVGSNITMGIVNVNSDPTAYMQQMNNYSVSHAGASRPVSLQWLFTAYSPPFYAMICVFVIIVLVLSYRASIRKRLRKGTK